MLQQEAALRDLAGAVLQDTTSLHGQTKRASGYSKAADSTRFLRPGFIEALVSCLSPQSKPCSSYPPVGQA